MNLCGFQLRDDKAGLLWLDFPSAYTVEDLDLVATTLGKYLEDHAPQDFGILLDISAVEKTQTATRRRFAAFLGDHAELFSQRCKAVAMVVSSAMHKGAISTIFWIKPIGSSNRAFLSRPEAEAWLTETCAGELELPNLQASAVDQVR